MRYADYLKDKIRIILLNILCMLLLTLYLKALGNQTDQILLLAFVWTMILIFCLSTDYMSRRRYVTRLLQTLDGLEQKYLIGEVMDKPVTYEDRLYCRILKTANKSMLERITEIRHERMEYQEYMEQWIHEVKTPISVMKLMCENDKTEITRKFSLEVEKTDSYVEQVLFYARSGNVERDYIVKELELSGPVERAVISSKQALIQNGMRIGIECSGHTVFSDSKWIEFILGQLLSNCCKYKKSQGSNIHISADIEKGGVVLCVEDNGIGIAPEELGRIFDKGFTGSNGRRGEKSTGIGLYLCKMLCDKLGLMIKAESKVDEFTRIRICFPKGSFVRMQD